MKKAQQRDRYPKGALAFVGEDCPAAAEPAKPAEVVGSQYELPEPYSFEDDPPPAEDSPNRPEWEFRSVASYEAVRLHDLIRGCDHGYDPDVAADAMYIHPA